MALLSLVVRMIGQNLWTGGRGVSVGLGVAAIMVSPGVGTGVAHAQECDPVETAKLLASDGAEWDQFGVSVSISGNTAFVGAYWDDDNGDKSGSAYVFTRSGGVWIQQAKILPADGAVYDDFGYSVSVNGNTAIIGARRDDDNGNNSGSAYIFTRSGSMWTQQAKLLPGDGAQYALFGESVSISGDTAVIGARRDEENGNDSGSAYVFVRSGGVWIQQAKLLPNDGAAGDQFGISVSVSGDTAVIGAYGDDDNSQSSGSVYVFIRSESVWTQQDKLLPNDGAEEDWFGYSVSVNGNTALVGAWRDEHNGVPSGSAYVFVRSGGVWTQQAKLLPGDGAPYDGFGISVSISDEAAVIGVSLDDDNGLSSGSAYVFMRSAGVWTERAKLLALDGGVDDNLGRFVSINGDTIIIGAYRDADNGDSSGSVYVFNLGCDDCPADLNGDGIVDTRDFIAFLGAWSVGDSLADWDENGLIDTRDFIAYLGDWAAGCP